MVVKLTNSLRDNQERYYPLSEFKSKTKEIKKDLENLIPLNPGVFDNIINYALFLNNNNIYENDEELDLKIKGSISISKAKEVYRLIYNFVMNNKDDLFASKEKGNYNPEEGHIGALLDSKHYKRLYGQSVVAICSDELRDIIGVLSYKRYNKIKRGLIALGCIPWSGEDGRWTLTLGKNKVEKCVIIIIDTKYFEV